MKHPLYDDEALVAKVTKEHLDAGRTVLQMFQLADTEINHSIRVLELLQLPESQDVLSLGCGVGGMERYWKQWRPDFTFELVNNSAAQLDLCVCKGRRVKADAQHYHSPQGPFDVVVMAYVLGHLYAPSALVTCRDNTKKGGVAVVLDVFDGTEEFNARFQYNTPHSGTIRNAGFVELATPFPWRLMQFIHQQAPWALRHATPGLWVRHV